MDTEPQPTPPAPAPPKDLTGILLPQGQRPDEDIRKLAAEHLQRDLLVRVAPLDAVGLVQVEVHGGADGMPCEDPELVGRLSVGGRAVFVHVNHTAKQAMVHAFIDGKPEEGFAGEPGDVFEAKLKEALGTGPFSAITAADDGSRIGIGVAATRTVAMVRGIELMVPPGTPTDLGSFQFHDRGLGLDEGGERLAFVAFDARAARNVFTMTPGARLAELLGSAPPGMYGPLEGAREPVQAALAQLGAKTPGEAKLEDGRALELCALAAARAFSSGDRAAFWDERVLPLFSLSSDDPKIEASDVEDLDDCDSILHAMVDVLPYGAPPGGEGSTLSLIGDDEIGPLAPWARPGEEVTGSIFLLRTDRLLPLVRLLDGRRLTTAIQKFERAWFRAARPGQPEGDALVTFSRARAEEGAPDVDRVLRNWTELRVVLEVAHANKLAVGLLFYEVAAAAHDG